MADESTEEVAPDESGGASPDESSEGVFEEETEDASGEDTANESEEEVDEDQPTDVAPAGPCPVAPTGLMAKPGMNEVRLAWSAGALPKDDTRFGEALAFYVSVTGPESRVLRTTDPTLTVAGLRNGVEYSFEVFAATAAGRSEPEGPVSATPTTGVEGVVAGLIVEFADGVDPQPGVTDVPGRERVAEVDLTVAEQVTDTAVLVEFSEPVDLDTAEKIAADLASADQVEWAEPDQFFFTAAEDAITSPPVQTVSVPTDIQYATDQWNLWDTFGISVGDGATFMTDAWAGARGDGVNVAVIDTGITGHPDLDDRLVPGYDFVSNPEQLASSRQPNAPPVAFDGDYVDEDTHGALGRDANPRDPGDWRGVAPIRDSSWHGTKIAGLIAAEANDDGITGIAPNAKIQPIRALSWRGGLLSDIAASITWASGGAIDGVPVNENQSKVINMSFAVETICPTALQQAIDGAIERGSILVAAAGNANDDAAKFAPGNCNGVITVAATNRDGLRADYSNYGSTIDISAPGGDATRPVTTTSNSGTQAPDQPSTAGDYGTSIAAAHVSAAAAILASRNANLAPSDAYTQLTGENLTKTFANLSCDTNPDYTCGSGILSLAIPASSGSCIPSTNTYISDGTPYTVVKFQGAGSCSWNVPTGVTSVDVLTVGGGGGGGAWVGGGGGGGGVTESPRVTVTPGTDVSVTVGGGGTGAVRGTSTYTYGSNGGTSTFGSVPPVEALGGGVGASIGSPPGTGTGVATGGGGNGPGAPNTYAGGTGTVPLGGNGGNAYTGFQPHAVGGGGGAGGNGGNGTGSVSGSGGAGVSSTYSGDTVFYGGGGGGSAHGTWPGGTLTDTSTPGTGGVGGGGTGGQVINPPELAVRGADGADGQGGGGGGGANYWQDGTSYTSTGGDGGDGVVIVRYSMGPASVSTSTVVASPLSLTANGSSASTVTVTARDANGNAVPNQAIFVATSAGTLSAGPWTTNSSGTVTATLTSPTSVGSATVSAHLGTSASATLITQTATVTFTAGTPSTMWVYSGGNQSAMVGTALANAPKVQVLDANNNGVPDVNVTFAVQAGGGSLGSPATVTTDANGIATAPTWTLGTVAGSLNNEIRATSPALPASMVQIFATATPGAAATIAVNAGDGQSATAGSAVTANPSVVVTDQYGNAKSGVDVTFSVQTGGGSLATSGTVTTNASGIATSPAWTLGTTAGSNTLRATSGSLGGSPVTFTATGTAGAATKLVLTTSAAGAASGAAFTTQPVVAIQDANSNTLTADSSSVVTATVSAGGTLVGTSTAAAVNGVATFTDLGLSGLTGSYTLTFSSGALTQATQSILLATGAAATLSITQQPSGAVYGAVLTTQPIVRLLDSGGNLVTTAGVLITASLGSGSGALAGTAVLTNASGIATFTGLAITATPGPYTLNFTGPGLAAVTSSSFSIAKADQATLTMSSAASATYGQTITLASTGGSGTGATVYAVDAGTCTIVSGVLTLGDATSLCSVSATKVGDANYNAVSSASQTITIAKAGQTVTFTSTVPPSPLPTATYTPTAAAISTVTGLASGVTPTFTASGTCSLAGGVVTFNSTGLCTVTSSAGSSTNFLAAADATQSILVGALNQNITFTQPGNVAFGSAGFGLSASASSGLPVSFTLGGGTTNSACTVSSLGVVTIVAVGTCEAVASQAGDAQYAAASSVTRAFQVVPALPTAPTLTSASASSQAVTVGFTAPGFDGGVPITAYRLVATGGGTTVTSTACTASPCTISGLTNGTAYTVTVAAINSVGTGPASSATGSLTPATAAFAVGALAATPGDTTVALTWVPLTNAQLGGGTFTEYEVSRRVAGTSAWTPVPTSLTSQSTASYTVTGLNNGTSYDFRVVAITSANDRPITGNTAEVVQYPSTVPSAPLSPVVLASTATDVQFSWSAPLSDGGSTLTNPNYTVTVTTTAAGANTPITCNPGTSGTNCLATGLSNGALYTFTVKANNRMGSSAGASVTYVVPSSDATLSNLVVTSPTGGVALSPVFAPGTTAYVASVANAVSSVTVTPTTSDPGASVTVNGIAVASGSLSGSISLAVGSNTVTVLVTASDPSSTGTYTITITRQAASGGGGSGGSSGGSSAPNVPVMPPASVMNGGQVGGVLLGGLEETGVVWVRTSTNSGWQAVAPDFTLSVDTESRQRAPEPLLSNGAMQVPQGGFVVVNATGYAPQSTMAVFAIPRGEERVVGKVAARAMTNAIWLGSTVVGDGGSVSFTMSVPMTMDIGDYVLQINGESTQAQLRSVNLQLVVLAGGQSRTSRGLVQRAGFYADRSDQLSASGARKVRSLLAAVPRNAEDVRVEITGVSVGLDSFEENLAMAGKRATKMARTLKAAGLTGEYVVSVSATFTVDAAERSSVSKLEPLMTKTGKPLTTVTVLYELPAEAT